MCLTYPQPQTVSLKGLSCCALKSTATSVLRLRFHCRCFQPMVENSRLVSVRQGTPLIADSVLRTPCQSYSISLSLHSGLECLYTTSLSSLLHLGSEVHPDLMVPPAFLSTISPFAFEDLNFENIQSWYLLFGRRGLTKRYIQQRNMLRKSLLSLSLVNQLLRNTLAQSILN